MEESLVSVIVPIYNAESYLKKCLESLINQTYQNVDIILIDDGSKDSSLSIAKEYKRKDNRIRVYSQENMGLVATRKRGVSLAKGEFVSFVDSDDWIDKNMYEQLVHYMLSTNCDLVSSGIYHNYENEDMPCEEIFDLYSEGFYENLSDDIYPSMLYDFKKLEMGLKCTLVNKLFRKDILEQIYQDIDTRVFYGEDALTIYQYCLKCSSIYILRKSYYHYYIRNNSMCRSASEELVRNTYYLYENLKSAFTCYERPYILLKQLRQYVLQLESHTLKMLFDIDVLGMANWNFEGYEEIIGKRIVIYGAGACGQALYRKLCQSENENMVVAWLDKDAEGKSEQCLFNIRPIQDIVRLKYDYIVVAIKNQTVAQKVRQELNFQYHIEPEKIVWYKASYENIW